ncbi:MAG: Ig-like domain-containing protein [Gaiellales bacterium]
MAVGGLRALTVALVLVLAVPLGASAAGVKALFNLSSPSGGPFPSDVFTVPDPSHNTGVRVNLPKPNCATRPSDCFDIDELNTLDGFNMQPRLRIPFSGPIVPSTVVGNVFLVSLGNTLGGRGSARIEVNQVVWDPATKTLFAESDALLDQHTRYGLIVTNGVRDMAGDPVEAGAFATFRQDLNFGQTKAPAAKAYRKALLDALAASGVPHSRVVAASVFTTQSATAVLVKIRDQIKAVTPPAATVLGTFPRVPMMTVVFNRQVKVSGTDSISTSVLPMDLFDPTGQIGALAFGHYSSPDYQTAAKYIPPVGTRTGTPVKQADPDPDIYFNLFIPAGTPPASGWPVAIFGHGFTDSKQGAPFAVAASFAAQGIATIAINVVGHGGGAGGTLTVLPAGGMPFSAGGRGIDQDGNGSIDSTEGVNAAPPRTIVSNRDGLRQTVVDLMQLVRVIETDGIPGLDGSRIYYAGQSFGGIYGTKFVAIEPSLPAGVLNVPGGPIIDIARISPVFRLLITQALSLRVPQLLNGPFPVTAPFFGFNENIPLRNLPPVVNNVPGAVAIQEVIDNIEWASQAGNPVAYAPHIVKSPLAGMEAKSVIFQFARGDVTVPNPTTTNILRAGALIDDTALFRNDLADNANSEFPNNPHTFLTRIVPAPVPGGVHPDVIAVALNAQAQIAVFFASDGTMVIDPDGAGTFFEVPVSLGQRPLLEKLNLLP